MLFELPHSFDLVDRDLVFEIQLLLLDLNLDVPLFKLETHYLDVLTLDPILASEDYPLLNCFSELVCVNSVNLHG